MRLKPRPIVIAQPIFSHLPFSKEQRCVLEGHRILTLKITLSVLASGWLLSVAILAAERSVSLKASVDRTKITIGDVVQLNVEVKRPESVTIAFSEVGSQLGDWLVRRSSRVAAKKSEEGLVSDFLKLELAAYRIGEIEIPALQAEALDSTGKKQLLKSEPIKIKVESVLAGGDQELKEIKPQAEIPTDYKPLLMFLAALVALAVIVHMVLQYFRARRKILSSISVDTRSPEEIAREAIRILLAKKLAEKGFLKEFYLELSEIVKKYLGDKLGIPSLERTTEEFLSDLKGTSIPWEHSRLIKEFLMDCDLVKFAKYKPVEQEITQVVQRAWEIIEVTQSKPKQEYVLTEVSK